MRKESAEEKKNKKGACVLISSRGGLGKTYSLLTAPPGRMAHINNEPKEPGATLIGHERFNDITFLTPEDFFDDEQSMLNQWVLAAKEGKFPFRTVMDDGMTFSMSNMQEGLEDQRYEINIKKDKVRGDLIDRTRFEQDDYGSLGSLMLRRVKLLNKLSHFGVLVICTALETNRPNYNPSLEYGPALVGKKFPDNLTASFDLVGRIVEPWRVVVDEETKEKKIVPPVVSFRSDDNTFMWRVTGGMALRPTMYLNWDRILTVLRGGE